jgi:hypothetical protein
VSYEIPLEDETGIIVCRVSWDGDLYNGSAAVSPITGHEEIARNLADMILTRQDLRELKFRSEGDESTVNGWRGYEGVVASLRIVSPALGLQIGHIGGDTPPLGNERADEIAWNESNGGIE